MLVVMSGQPATGKTTLSRALARDLGAVHLRIDTIEQAMVRSGITQEPLDEAGYIVAYALAEDLLGQGHTVVADCVNPFEITRDAWRAVAERAGVPAVEVEIICGDRDEHAHRVATRTSDIPDLVLPTWQEILDREVEPWTREHIVVDTAGRSVAESLAELREGLRQFGHSAE